MILALVSVTSGGGRENFAISVDHKQTCYVRNIIDEQQNTNMTMAQNFEIGIQQILFNLLAPEFYI